MLKAGSSIAGMTIPEIVEQDFKTFKLGETSIGIGQVMTLDFDEIAKDMPKYIAHLDDMCVKNNYKLAVLFVTDAVRNGSYLLYSTGVDNIIGDAYKISDVKEGTYLPDMVSRKKQMYPALAAVISNN